MVLLQTYTILYGMTRTKYNTMLYSDCQSSYCKNIFEIKTKTKILNFNGENNLYVIGNVSTYKYNCVCKSVNINKYYI